MARVLTPAELQAGQLTQARSLHFIQAFRLVTGLVILLGSIVSMLGVSWDIQWHTFVGRDRTLIPPHLMMLSGIALAGLTAMIVVFAETLWTRRQQQLTAQNTRFADLFYGPLGAYIAGFGALTAAIAFPLDSYWHALYGIDVSIWAPFHVMILTGGALAPLGATYMFVSAAQLGSRTNDRRSIWLAYLGAVVALATIMGIFSFLLADATDNPGFIQFGSVTLNLFPVFSGLLVSWVFVIAAQAIPWRWAATAVALGYLFFGALFQVFVPPATSKLVVIEQLTYRRELGQFANLSIVATRFWSLTPIIVAILIDLFARRAEKKGWSGRKRLLVFALVSLIGCLPVVVLDPTLLLELAFYTGVIGFPISMLLGFFGTTLGTWFGLRTARSLQQLEGR
ncbi:MAG TPA: hypothetical protein VFQ30_07770 [Ktedonobacteraceae bacterium]|nr:hypothetical protein [Ktedonobacteraceae bacterium]